MTILLALVIAAGLALIVFGAILAADPEGRAGGWAALCMLGGFGFVVGAVISFGVMAYHALSKG